MGCDYQCRDILTDQRLWTMSHLTRGEGLGLTVGCFFQLERAFTGDRVVNPSPKHDKSSGLLVPSRDFIGALRPPGQARTREIRKFLQAVANASQIGARST